jgi:molecular chaperone GrpE
LSGPEDEPAEGAEGPSVPAAAEPEPLPEVPASDEEGAAEAYRQRARLAEDRLAEVLTAYREFRRETEAYRDRLTRQLQRRLEQRHDTLLLRFIDILDNFDRALEASQTAGDSLVEGLILVRTQLLQMLQEEGLERIPVLGLPFDPHVAEAMATEPVDDPDQHQMVVQETLRGYRIKGRIARAAQVVIGEYVGALPGEPGAARRHEAPVIGEPVAVLAVASESADEDGGPSLEEIIARAEARDALEHPAPPAAVRYDDLTELAEVDDELALEADADAAPKGEPDDEG